MRVVATRGLGGFSFRAWARRCMRRRCVRPSMRAPSLRLAPAKSPRARSHSRRGAHWTTQPHFVYFDSTPVQVGESHSSGLVYSTTAISGYNSQRSKDPTRTSTSPPTVKLLSSLEILGGRGPPSLPPAGRCLPPRAVPALRGFLRSGQERGDAASYAARALQASSLRAGCSAPCWSATHKVTMRLRSFWSESSDSNSALRCCSHCALILGEKDRVGIAHTSWFGIEEGRLYGSVAGGVRMDDQCTRSVERFL